MRVERPLTEREQGIESRVGNGRGVADLMSLIAHGDVMTALPLFGHMLVEPFIMKITEGLLLRIQVYSIEQVEGHADTYLNFL